LQFSAINNWLTDRHW